MPPHSPWAAKAAASMVGIATVLASLAASNETEARPMRPVIIEGNIVLTDDVYLSVLELARVRRPGRQKPKQEARAIRRTLLDFLKASGYDLASVEAQSEADVVRVFIDEGRLDKVIFVGEGAFQQVQLRFRLNLPSKVFNRPLLERKLDELISDSDVVGARYEVVPIRAVDHEGIQVDDPDITEAFDFLSSGTPHELRIYLDHEGFTAGFDFSFGYRPPDGLFANSAYILNEPFLTDDQLRFDAGLSSRVIEAFEGSPLALSRAFLQTRYFTPPFISDVVRSFVALEGELIGRDRLEDLGIESYFFAALSASLNLGFEPTRWLTFSLGGGFEQRFLFGIREAEDPDENPVSPVARNTPDDKQRLFVGGELQLIFNQSVLRRDRRHSLLLSARQYTKGGAGTRPVTETNLDYQVVFLFGYDELWLGVDGTYRSGVPFYNEVAFGDGFLRAAFLSTIFMRQVTSAQLEYRVSLNRDILKLSVFNDFSVFNKLKLVDADGNGVRDNDGVRVADNVGLGLHILMFDAFQVNTYLGVGFTSDGEFDAGASLQVEQAF